MEKQTLLKCGILSVLLLSILVPFASAQPSFPIGTVNAIPITFFNYQTNPLSSNGIIYVGATNSITGNVIGFNALAYQSYGENCNLNNIEFSFYNGSLIYGSQLLGNVINPYTANSACTSSSSPNALSASANVTWALNLAGANSGNIMGAGSASSPNTITIYLDILSSSAFSFVNNVGESPQLSCQVPTNTINCFYGEYDNGKKMYLHYTNFSTTSLISGISGQGNFTTNNGFLIATGTSTTVSGLLTSWNSASNYTTILFKSVNLGTAAGPKFTTLPYANLLAGSSASQSTTGVPQGSEFEYATTSTTPTLTTSNGGSAVASPSYSFTYPNLVSAYQGTAYIAFNSYVSYASANIFGNSAGYLVIDAEYGVHQGGPSCFAYGTIIFTSNGPEPIQNIKQGTYVTTFNVLNGSSSLSKVIQVKTTFQFFVSKIKTINKTVIAAEDQQFVMQNGTYVQAQFIKPNDKIGILENGTMRFVTVDSASIIFSPQFVFDFNTNSSYAGTMYTANSFLSIG